MVLSHKTKQSLSQQHNRSEHWPHNNSRFDSWPFHFQLTTLGKLFTQRASVTKQYNSVPVKERLCPAAGKVTIGLVSHWQWPSTPTSLVYPPTGSQPKEGNWAAHLHYCKLKGTMEHFTCTFFLQQIRHEGSVVYWCFYLKLLRDGKISVIF